MLLPALRALDMGHVLQFLDTLHTGNEGAARELQELLLNNTSSVSSKQGLNANGAVHVGIVRDSGLGR